MTSKGNKITKYVITYIDKCVHFKKLEKNKKKVLCIEKITNLISNTGEEEEYDMDEMEQNNDVADTNIFNREKTDENKYNQRIKKTNYKFPQLKGDKTIQIGCSFVKYGETIPYKNIILTLGTCDPITNTIVKTYTNERELLLDFVRLINKEDPDIITGYNIVGFDTPWLWKRAKELGIQEQFYDCSKIKYGSFKVK